MSIERNIRDFLTAENYISNNERIENTDSLLERGFIDSVGVAKLVSFLEEKYRIQVSDDDLMPENFDSLLSITKYVQNKLG